MLLDQHDEYTFQLPMFEGPLDLLLRLIEREELDITSIALAQVADQYLAHVRAIESPDPAALSAFLVLAAKLLLIKSRALLPRPPAPRGPDDPVDEGEQLAQQLREYQRYKQVAAALHQRQERGQRTYNRLATPPLPVLPQPDQLDVSVDQMVTAMQRRLRLMRAIAPPDVPLPAPKIITVPEMSQRIRERLHAQPWIDFSDLLSLAVRRVEVIVTLWSVLEMLKRREVVVEQADLFAPIMIGRGADLR